MFEIAQTLAHSNFVLGQQVTEDEIKAEITKLKLLAATAKNKDTSLKIILNSIYGVVGFQHFILYNRDVAQSVTKQSEDLIKYCIKVINEYFRIWHTHTETLQKIGIKTIRPFTKDAVNYADTDSIFIVWYDVRKHTDFDGTITDFVLKANDFGLMPYLAEKLREYVDHFHGFQTKINGDPIFEFVMEQINDAVLWVSKKRYIKNPIWDEGKFLKPLEDIQVKGLEINKPSYPKFVRTKLKELVYYIMAQKSNLNTSELLEKIARIKEEFQTINVVNICETVKANHIGNYITITDDELIFAKGTPEHIRAVGYYNYTLKRSQYKNKYNFIQSSEKIQTYYSKDKNGVFAFQSNIFPVEIAPPVDMDAQFEKVFLTPLNHVLEVLNVPKLNSELLLFESIW